MALLTICRRFSLFAACVTLIVPSASAATTGRAEVGVTRFLGLPYFESFPIPIGATQYTTPPAEVAATLHLNLDTARVHARAVTSLDIPNGALSGSIATFARTELLGGSVRANAQSIVRFDEIFEVQSETLPDGTPVDVVFSPMLVHMGGASSTGFGPCCLIRSVYEFIVLGGSLDSGDNPTHVGSTGVLGGGGHDMQDVQFAQPFGPYAIPASVGDRFGFSMSFETESEAFASAVFETNFGVHAGQSDATATATMLFATEVVPAAEGLTAADGVSSGGIGSGGSEGYLFHAASGLRLPGLEVFDPANVRAHLLPLVRVPEPRTFLLIIVAAAGFPQTVGRKRQELVNE